MKKLIVGVAFASVVVSCKKIQAGSNHGVLKAEENAGRYSDDVMSDEATAKYDAMHGSANAASNDTTKATGMQTAPAKMDSAKIVTPTSVSAAPEAK